VATISRATFPSAHARPRRAGPLTRWPDDVGLPPQKARLDGDCTPRSREPSVSWQVVDGVVAGVAIFLCYPKDTHDESLFVDNGLSSGQRPSPFDGIPNSRRSSSQKVASCFPTARIRSCLAFAPRQPPRRSHLPWLIPHQVSTSEAQAVRELAAAYEQMTEQIGKVIVGQKSGGRAAAHGPVQPRALPAGRRPRPGQDVAG